MTPIRCWILAGVSTDGQAREEKDSIPDQLRKCRKFIASNDCIEAGFSVMDGYTRNDYDSLEVAMRDIPPLAETIQAAESNEYDILLLDNYERLGDLGLMVGARFRRLRKQIHSTRQSGRLIDPDEYDPYASEAADIDMYVEGIINRYRNNKIRRGWLIGVPKRIDDGLNPFRIPYGYTRIDKKTPAVQNDNVKYIFMMKNWLFDGRPVVWILQQLDAIGAPTPSGKAKRWHSDTVKNILLNPFYAGIVAIGQKRKAKPKKYGKPYRQRAHRSDWKKYSIGKHVPLWDEATYMAIQNEYARREGLKNYARVVYPLAGLLQCSECSQRLVRVMVSRSGKLIPGLACKHGPSHIKLDYQTAIEHLACALKTGLDEFRVNAPDPETERKTLEAQIEEYLDKRTQIQEGYKAKIFSKEEASRDIGELERLEQIARKKLEKLESATQSVSDRLATAQQLGNLPNLAEWIRTYDSALVNMVLSTLCAVVWVSPDLEFTIDWKEE